jgi:S-DNA-T family DNA segregation ATPase FtsK/SpoIIIE
MMQSRDLKLDLCALGLLALVTFLALALLTYSPADPVVELVPPLSGLYQPDVLVYPQHATVQNLCGAWGALAASMLLTGLGLGAYYVVLSLGTLDALLLLRREIDTPILRTCGWCLSIVGLTTIVALTIPQWTPGPVIGAGGYLGALGAGVLEMHFATTGGLILATSLWLGGLLLATDYALVRAASWLLHLVTTVVSGRHIRAPWAAKHGLGTETRSRGASELTVRVGGATIRQSGEAVDDEDEEEEDDDARATDDWVGTEDDAASDASWEDSPADEGAPTARHGAAGAEPEAAGPRVRRRDARQERQQVMQCLDEASLTGDAEDYQLPTLDLLVEQDEICFDAQTKEVRRKAKILERTFANFGFHVKVVEIETGPVIAQYEVELEAGLRLSRITGLADDLAIALRVPSVRIVAPIPGKNTVGIEVPNETRQVVRLREVMEETNGKMKKMKIPLFLGKDVSGKALTVDLATMPHLLIAGRTGTGKSVCLNAIISSILMTRRPDEVRMLMIDPKMVELSGYGRLPHLMHPVVTDMRKAEAIFAWAVEKMEERYALLARTGVRHIASYNQLGVEELVERLQPESEEQRLTIPEHLPYIVLVADEIADLMLTAGKEVEQHIIRLAQKSRAVGIHLILATQKPTVDVITGLIKSNLPARISFQVASRIDSRVVLDEMGAERLLGNGDMLFLWPGTSTLLRGQGTYVSDDEINAIVATVSTGEQNFVNELVNMQVEPEGEGTLPGQLRKRDELYESAIDIVLREGRGSVSLLQRALGIGYGRAARLVDFMAEDGIVGEYNGSQAREVLWSLADWEKMQGLESSPDTAAPAAPRRSHVIRPEPGPDDADERDNEEFDQDDVEVDEFADDELEDDDEGEPQADEDEADEGYSDDDGALDDEGEEDDDEETDEDEELDAEEDDVEDDVEDDSDDDVLEEADENAGDEDVDDDEDEDVDDEDEDDNVDDDDALTEDDDPDDGDAGWDDADDDRDAAPLRRPAAGRSGRASAGRSPGGTRASSAAAGSHVPRSSPRPTRVEARHRVPRGALTEGPQPPIVTPSRRQRGGSVR